jgi:hypothetical protein
MYDLKEALKANISAEITAMAAFLSTRWKNVDNVETLLRIIAQAAEENAQCAIEDHPLTKHLREQQRNREVALKSLDDSGMLPFYDQACQLLEDLEGQVQKVHFHGNETLYEAGDATMKSIKKALSAPDLVHLKKAQPIGLAEMSGHYQANNEAWDDALRDEFSDRNAFEGANTANGSQGGFVSAVSLIIVVQTKVTHNTPPINQLIEGVYDHLVDLRRAMNTLEILADLENLSQRFKADEAVFSVKFEPAHKLTKVLYALAQQDKRGLGGEDPEQEYLKAVAECKLAEPLSEEELKTRRAEAAEEISAMFKSILKPKTSAQAKAREVELEQDRQAVRELLQSL